MGGLCSRVSDLAGYFLLAALVIAILEIAVPLLMKLFKRAPEPEAKDGKSREPLGPILDALARLLTALKDLPAWVAVFLAGLALVWTAASAPHLCS